MTFPDPSVYPRFASEVLLPLCRDRFADREHGGFHERLDAEGMPRPALPKRAMVQCRQLYVLSHAALLGDRSGEAVAERGFAFLRSTYRDLRHGGWYFAATRSGEPTNRMKDAYAHAFILFTLGYIYRAFAWPAAIELARETYDVMLSRLRAPSGGFWDEASEDWQPSTALQRQNPHMHLLEALHSMYEATHDTAWLGEADNIVALFSKRFFDPSTGTLGEFFAADWTPHAERGHIVEPGHHFEWVWLLHRHAALTGKPIEAAAEVLFAMAERHGFDPDHGGIHDQIDRAGNPLLTSRRIWTITEAIKAYVARIEAGLPHRAGEPDRLIGQLFEDFLRPAQLGWIETTTRDGHPTMTDLPGSTPYHIYLAATEVARVLTPAVG